MARKLNMSAEHMNEIGKLWEDGHSEAIGAYGNACYSLGVKEATMYAIAGIVLGAVVDVTIHTVRAVRRTHKALREANEKLNQYTAEVQNKNT
jgi:hypothetical protein